jgi:chemotaxis protein CheZ
LTRASPEHRLRGATPDTPIGPGEGPERSDARASGVAENIPAGISEDLVPQAIDHLAAVVEVTERAANEIMNACDALLALAPSAGASTAAALDRLVATIFSACAFQDLAGQRITAVTKTLRRLDRDLGRFAGWPPARGLAAVSAHATESYATAALAGPQRPEDALDQAAADRLFSQSS